MSDRLLTIDGCQDEACQLHRLLQVAVDMIESAPPERLGSVRVLQIMSLLKIGTTMAKGLTNALLEDFEAHAREAQS